MKKKILILILPVILMCSMVLSACNVVNQTVYTTPNSTTINTTVYTTSSGATSSNLTTSIKNVKNSVVEIYSNVNNGYACGSGVIYMDDSVGKVVGTDVINYYILTNFHVIENGKNYQVITTNNNKQYSASLIGGDYYSDIAVIRISTTDALTVCNIYGNYNENGDELAKDSNNNDTLKLMEYLELGQTVFAIGNPLGELPGSVSVGNISYLGRKISVQNKQMSLIQTTAAINSGNSGGGLFDANGDLIGIVNAKVMDTGVEGIGFAIPINYAYKIASSLYKNYAEVNNEPVRYGYVEGRLDFAITMLANNNNNVYIYSIESNSPCLTTKGTATLTIGGISQGEVTGVSKNDRIYSINGTLINSNNYLEVYNSLEIGDTINLVVVRTISSFFSSQTYYITFSFEIGQYIYEMNA